MTCRFALAGAVGALAACGSAPADGDLDIDGAPPLALVEELRLGSADDPDVGFTQIAGVAIGDDGLIYVLERRDRHVRVFDPAGAPLRVIGGPGAGPGEFEFPWSFGLVADTLWVVDHTQRRFTLFDRRDGRLLTTFPVRRATVEAMPGVPVQLAPNALRGDGFVTGAWSVPVVPNPPADSFWMPTVRMDRDGAIVDTIRLHRWAFSIRQPVTLNGQELIVPPAPPAALPTADALDGGYFNVYPAQNPRGAVTSTFAVVRIGPAGDTLFHREIAYTPGPYDDAWIDQMLHHPYLAIARERTGADSAVAATALRRAYALPPLQPPVTRVVAGSDGGVWLRRNDDASGTVQWLVLGHDGAVRGVVALARSANVLWSDGAHVWIAEPDELQVPWLVRYRVSSSGG